MLSDLRARLIFTKLLEHLSRPCETRSTEIDVLEEKNTCSRFRNLACLLAPRHAHESTTGSIPPQLGNLSALQYLHLGANQLNGEFSVVGIIQKLMFCSRTSISVDVVSPTQDRSSGSLKPNQMHTSISVDLVPPTRRRLGHYMF